MELTLERIDARNPALNAVIWLDREQALAAARDSGQRLSSGAPARPFEGVPLLLKDFVNAVGQPNTMGSRAIDDAPSTHDDMIVSLFRNAGFAFVGRTNTPEFVALTDTVNSRYGATKNPWNLERSAGGSSGGAGSAVAAGLVTVAHASDGGGSIRIPGSANGLVGIKPSRGRVPAEFGHWNFASTDGVLTRTVADSAALLDVLVPGDPHGWFATQPPARPFSAELGPTDRKLRIGILALTNVGVTVDDECVAGVELAAKHLESLGHSVSTVDAYLFDPQTLGAFVGLVMSAYTANSPITDAALCDAFIRFRLDGARAVTAIDYVALEIELQEQARRVVAQWGDQFDVLVTPTMATTVPPVGTVYREANDDPGGERLLERRMATFTLPANLSGLPAATFPVATDRDGMPVGVQLIAGPGDEATLFQLGHSLEQEFLWHQRRPPTA
jgi:amidase